MSTLESSRNFWEEKAIENPYWYVSSYGPYERTSLKEFWESGDVIWKQIQGLTGYTPRPEHSVVEIGCGVGRLTRAISPQVAHVDSFDISENMLEIARGHKLPNVTFHLGGDSLQPISDRCCDFALAYCVFQHLPSVAVLAKYLAEMERVTRGAIAFTLAPRTVVDNFRTLIKFKADLREKLGRSGPRRLGTDEWLGIRPRRASVLSLCDGLYVSSMGAERDIYWKEMV